MTAVQSNDAMLLLGQGMSLKNVALTLQVSEWDIVEIIPKGGLRKRKRESVRETV